MDNKLKYINKTLLYSLPNSTILDSSKNKSRLFIFSGVDFYCRLNLDLGFGVGKQSHTKYTHKKDIVDARMPECTLRSNCTENQADPGVHSLNFICLG